MKVSFRSLLGSFRLLGRRARELGQPGLGIYAFAGEQAAKAVSADIVDRAHRNECAERSLADELKAMTADGKVDAAELRRLSAMPGALTRCAERSHDITEAAAL